MYSHWPESSDFRPESEEHLRKYIICRSGFRESTDIPIEYAEDQPALTKLTAMAIEGAIRAAGSFAFVRPHPGGGLIRVYKAKSIAFDKLPQSEFNELNSAVEAVYREETGLDPDQVLRESRESA
jgi:hypothetical protein